MRVYASKYLGYGVRVGVSENLGSSRRTPALPKPGLPGSGTRYVAPRPRVLPPLFWATAMCTSFGVLVFPPLLVLAFVGAVATAVLSHRWELARRDAAARSAAELGR